MKSGIILNKMYAGGYLDDNIGHEIINLFKAHNDANYIYLCKDGNYTRDVLPEYTIQVRTHSTRTLEIISIAKIADKVYKEEIETIIYGNVPIVDIFENNKKQGTDTYVTFKAEWVIKPSPKNPVYIAYEGNRKRKDGFKNILVQDDAYILNEKKDGKYNFDVNETLRNYIDENTTLDSDYSKLSKIITEAFKAFKSNNGMWVAVDDKVTIEPTENKNEVEVTPAEIYGIGNLELPYSNAFSYFLRKYPKLLSAICQRSEFKDSKDIKELGDYFAANPEAELIVKREWQNIDILIEVDDKWVIVVENKIFSDLNGKVKKEFTQLNKYCKVVREEKEYKERNKIFVLLIPDHNNIDLQKYPNWKKVFYSSVGEYLENSPEYNTDINLREFTTMVKRHGVVDYNLGEMKRRFQKVLKDKQRNLNNK